MKTQETPVNNRPIKALLCQLIPFHKDKIKTIERVKVSLERYSEKDRLDIIVFPEMAFTGYNFSNPEDALPMAVCQHQGPEFEFARKLALKTKAYVAFGYMEKEVTSEGSFKLYNSAAVIDRNGVLLLNHRKWHLYYNDKFWAQEGNSFPSFILYNTQNQAFQCSLAICMDINPKDFTSGQHQLAQHLVNNKSDLLLFLTNWVDSDKDTIHRNDVAATFSYWISRMAPVVLSKKSVLMLVADRAGVEFDYFTKRHTRFYGSSSAIMLNPHKILSNLDVENEGFLLVDTSLP